MTTLRHEFYETDEKVVLSIFDRGADPEQVKVEFEPRKLSYTNGEKSLVLEPLKSQINTSASDYTVGKVKVEVRLAKTSAFRWGSLTGDSPDALSSAPIQTPNPAATTSIKPKKNWEGITTEILTSDKEKTMDEDPNIGGDSTLNQFFQKMYQDADEDTRRAMLKSYSESGGTTLSTNWNEVKQGKVEGKPPQGSEFKKWN